MRILEKYAKLLVSYCLDLQKGERLLISSTTAGEPLVIEVYKEALKAGAHIEINLSMAEQNKVFLENASDSQLKHISHSQEYMMNNFDAYLVIRASHNLRENNNVDLIKSKTRSIALAPVNKAYFERTANGSMKRTLCEYPTQAGAQEAGMSLTEYSDFVYNACKLNEDFPEKAWIEVRALQQKFVDYLNKSKQISYKNDKTNIRFSVEGRTWINSDGRTNMPSGEVFTGPVEDSVNGTVHFNYPSIYKGQEVRNITLEVKNGEVVKWEAEVGQEMLDSIMQIDGAKFFGEVAIGTNYNITKATKNILFDEKIGGTIHMAIGQSYIQTGGKNESSVHWDMISDMTKNGSIVADGVEIYKNGKFII